MQTGAADKADSLAMYKSHSRLISRSQTAAPCCPFCADDSDRADLDAVVGLGSASGRLDSIIVRLPGGNLTELTMRAS